jgi:DNA-binding CsgD family transcriptional regulator
MKKLKNEIAKPLKLSAREVEVLQWVACGKSKPAISKILSVSENTVRAHVKSICGKLKADDKAHAVAIALTHHVLPPLPSPERVIDLQAWFGLSKSPTQKSVESVSHIVRQSHASKPKGNVK